MPGQGPARRLTCLFFVEGSATCCFCVICNKIRVISGWIREIIVTDTWNAL